MIKLTRMNSDSPNVQNYDDARMFRYANGGFSAITKDYGEELAGSDAGSHIFHIGTGEVTHQGWQVEINGAGVDIELDNISSTEYYSIYLEINLSILSSQTASILSIKGTSTYPSVNVGDDLTTSNTGTSRVVLFKVKLENGVMSIQRQIPVLPYLKDSLDLVNNEYVAKKATNATYAMYTDSSHTSKTIEQRLTELGFKYPSSSQTISLSGGGENIGTIYVQSGSLYSLTGTSRQGNRVILNLTFNLSSGYTTSSGVGVLFGGTTVTSSNAIPEIYRPKEDVTFYIPSGRATYVYQFTSASQFVIYLVSPIKVVLKTDGKFSLSIDYTDRFQNGSGSVFNLREVNNKYITGIKIGYQANPIN